MTRTIPALAATLAAAALLVSGCGGNDPAPDSAGPATTAPAKDAAAKDAGKDVAATTGYISPKLKRAPVFAHHNHAVGVFKDVKVSSCGTSTGAVTAKGTVKNSASTTRDIVITMNWAVPTGGDVLGRGIAVVRDVAPGRTVSWATSTKLTEAAPVQCVVTARAGLLRS